MNTDMNGRSMVAAVKGDGGGRGRSLWRGPAVVTALVLLIPFLGNQFVEGWDWHPPAFAVVGAIVFGFALTYQLVTRHVDGIPYRAGVALALVTAFLLLWANFVQAADDVNPAAVMYLPVPLVGIIGVAVARLRPRGMARALFATALAQALALAMVLASRNPEVTPWSGAVLRGFAGNTFSVILFAGAALLFLEAAQSEAVGGVR